MFALKTQYDRLVSIASIDTANGKTRVNLGGTAVDSVLPATKYVPSKKITIPGISQDQIAFIIKHKLAHWEKFQEVPTPVAVVRNNAAGIDNKEGK